MAKKQRMYLTVGILLDEEKMFFLPTGDGKRTLPNLQKASRISKGRFKRYLKTLSFEGKVGKKFIKEDREFDDAIYRIRVYVLDGKPMEGMAFLYWDQINYEDFEEVLGPIVNKAYCYLPLLEKRQREIPLEPEDQELVDYLLDAISYFDARIPGRERKAFKKLTLAPSSIHRINEAFALICNDYGLNPKEYDTYFERKEKERQALR